ncbi:MAG: hypothetical protein R3A51_12055 [Nannocystaceae bacterium]
MAQPSPPLPEARLADRSVLIVLSPPAPMEALDGFCGAVITDPAAGLPDLSGKDVYLYGDAATAAGLELSAAARVQVIQERSSDPGARDDDAPWPVVRLGRLPALVHGVGVYYRCFFDPSVDYFDRIRSEHAFQSLTESTKPGRAHRTGIYLTPVRREGDALHFRLLRCSTNLSGPTEGFRATDRHIVDALNQEAALLFEDAAPLNHVLAQLYHNTPASAERKQAKARISSHADKTKDMPTSGIMAFCSFYERLERRSQQGEPLDPDERELTRLRFRLKEAAANEAIAGALPPQFTVTLHPNSVFFMPLSTNRLYTHELVPSSLDAAQLPTRLGYVVRCSKTAAVHEDGRTSLLNGDERVELAAPTPEGMQALRRLYAAENRTQAHIDYGDAFGFSMNEGDYRAPRYEPADEFRTYPLPTPGELFEALRASARFEDAGRGRRGAVLVAADDPRGVPIVRTTTQYALPAQPLQPVHTWLSRQIRSCASLATGFNNALIEVYTSAYTNMGAHSDQALDLEDDTEIALFSCYERADERPSRRLIVEAKEPGAPSFAIPLVHGSVVVFSVDTNRRFRHRIVLDPAAGAPNQWLGVTFRTSRTFVRAREGQPCLPDGARLTLASDEERREFYRLRRRENQETDFRYPPITYTLSASDLLPPDPRIDA